MIPGSVQAVKYRKVNMQITQNRKTIGRAGETFQHSTNMKIKYGIKAPNAQI